MAVSRPTPKTVQLDGLPTIYPCAAGMDIGAEEIVVAVPPDRDPEPVTVAANVDLAESDLAPIDRRDPKNEDGSGARGAELAAPPPLRDRVRRGRRARSGERGGAADVCGRPEHAARRGGEESAVAIDCDVIHSVATLGPVSSEPAILEARLNLDRRGRFGLDRSFLNGRLRLFGHRLLDRGRLRLGRADAGTARGKSGCAPSVWRSANRPPSAMDAGTAARSTSVAIGSVAGKRHGSARTTRSSASAAGRIAGASARSRSRAPTSRSSRRGRLRAGTGASTSWASRAGAAPAPSAGRGQ